MKSRIVRWTLTASAALSFVALGLVCAMWVRSFSVCDMGFHQHWSPAENGWTVVLWQWCSGRGGAAIARLVQPGQEDPGQNLASLNGTLWLHSPTPGYASPAPDVALPTKGGFYWHSGQTEMGKEYMLRGSGYQKMLIFPFWSLALLLAVLPILWLNGKIRAARRRRAGCCAKCGYDLRASAERCPECGQVAQVK